MKKIKVFIIMLFSLLIANSNTIQAETEKIIFDTDSAYFNDDGAALAMLLLSKKVEILGITLVAGNEWVEQGKEYMLHVLEVLRRKDIPMYLGSRQPLKNTAKIFERMKKEWGGTGYAGAFGKLRPKNRKDILPPFGGKFAKLRPKKGSAIDFIINIIEKYPDEITFLALGPHTNLYKAIKKKPGIAKKIKRLVFMGGNVNVPGNTTPHSEFNFFFDPESAQFVLRSEIPEKIMFGLDITNKAVITYKHFIRIVGLRYNTPIISLIDHDFGNRWPGFHKNPEKTGFIWDCLAAGYLIDPSFVTKSQNMYVDVITSEGPAYGGVTAYPISKKPGKKTKKVKAMLNLDFEKFLEMYRKLLTTPI